MVDEGGEIGARDEEAQLAGLRLAYLKHLAEQTGDTLDVVVDEMVVGGELGRLLVHLVGRDGDNGERREQLVGEIGEEHAHGEAVLRLHIMLIPPEEGIDG